MSVQREGDPASAQRRPEREYRRTYLHLTLSTPRASRPRAAAGDR